MEKTAQDQITLVTGAISGKSFLKNAEGRRITEKFIVASTLEVGNFVRIYTNKGKVYIYNKNHGRLLYKDTERKEYGNVKRLTDNVFAIFWYTDNDERNRLYSADGQLLTHEIFSETWELTASLIGVANNVDECGVLDESLRWVVEPKYYDIAYVNEGNLVGYYKDVEAVDLIKLNNGKVESVLHLDGRLEHIIDEDRYILFKNKKCGVADSTGKMIIPFDYDIIRQAGKYLSVCKAERYGLLDFNGKQVRPCQYTRIETNRVGSEGVVRALTINYSETVEEIPV